MPPQDDSRSARDEVVIDLEALWNRNFDALRDCRSLQRRIQEFGIRYPILDLLVDRGKLSRPFAYADAETTPLLPSEVPFRSREDQILTRACAHQRITTGQIVAAQQIQRNLSKLGAAVSLSYVLVELNYVRWKDLKEIDRSLVKGVDPTKPSLEDAETASGPMQAVKKRSTPGAPLEIEDCETTYVPSVGRAAKSHSASSGAIRRAAIQEPATHEEKVNADRRLRTRLRAVPESNLVSLLRETRLIKDPELDACVTERADRLRSSRTPVSLGEVLLDLHLITSSVAEVLLQTLERTGSPRAGSGNKGAP